MKLFERTSNRVSVYEVSMRDGLQNERLVISLADKLRLIDALATSGLRRIEVTSFVSPKWIPQLADADELLRQLAVHLKGRAPLPGDELRFSALCPNLKGFERAKAAEVKEIAVFLSASETHNRKNVNRSIEESLQGFREIVGPAREAGMAVRGYVSTVWGCPYEGDIDPKRVVTIAKELVELGCYQVSLGDTIGAGTPRQSKDILERVLDVIPIDAVAMHMHDTRGTALANILVGLELGIRTFDGSVGGMGGCPYAPGAAGNMATEDLVYMLHGMGIETGVDLELLVEAARVAQSLVERPLPGKVLKAGIRSLRA